MIKLYFKWIWIQIKLNLRSASFYLLTILLTFSFYITKEIVHEYNADVLVQICNSDSEIGKIVEDRLYDNSIDGFSFEKATSNEDMLRLVKRGDISCGISFEDETIIIYQAPGVMDGYVCGEILFPLILRGESTSKFKSYLENMRYMDATNGEIIPSEEAIAYVEDRFQDYMNSINVDIYDINEITTVTDIDDYSKNGSADKLLFVIRVAIVLIVVIISIFDNLNCDTGFYRMYPNGRRTILYLSKVLTTVILTVIIASVINLLLH